MMMVTSTSVNDIGHHLIKLLADKNTEREGWVKWSRKWARIPFFLESFCVHVFGIFKEICIET